MGLKPNQQSDIQNIPGNGGNNDEVPDGKVNVSTSRNVDGTVNMEVMVNCWGPCRVGFSLKVDENKNMSGGGKFDVAIHPIANAGIHINMDTDGKISTGVDGNVKFGPLLTIGGHADIDLNGQRSYGLHVHTPIGNVGVDNNREISCDVDVTNNYEITDRIESTVGKEFPDRETVRSMGKALDKIQQPGTRGSGYDTGSKKNMSDYQTGSKYPDGGVVTDKRNGADARRGFNGRNEVDGRNRVDGRRGIDGRNEVDRKGGVAESGVDRRSVVNGSSK